MHAPLRAASLTLLTLLPPPALTQKALSLVKWVKLMESEQWGDLLSQLSSIVGPQAYRVVAMLHKASLLVHWFACFFHYVAVVSGETDTWLDFEVPPPPSPSLPPLYRFLLHKPCTRRAARWLDLVSVGNLKASLRCDWQGLLDASAIVRYGESVYWSVSTLTTVG